MSEMDRRIAGALYGFLGYLTTLEEPITLGAAHEAPVGLSALTGYAEQSGLDIDVKAPIFPGDEPGECPECHGTEVIIPPSDGFTQPHGVPSRCMACYVHEEKLGEFDFMEDQDWTMLTWNGIKAGLALTRLPDGMVSVVIRRFGTS